MTGDDPRRSGQQAKDFQSWSLGRQAALAAALIGAAALAATQGKTALSAAAAALGVAGPPTASAPRNAGAARRPAPPVLTAELAPRRDARPLILAGAAAARRTAVLRVRADGRVTASPAGTGAQLATGDVVLKLDDRRAALARDLAAARLKDARSKRDRLAGLRGSAALNEAALETAETAAEIARIELAAAEEALADRRVTAPFDGVLSQPLVKLGDRVESGDAVATLDDRSHLLVEADAPETAFGRLTVGMAVSAAAAAYPGERFDGRLAEIDSRVSEADRTVRIRADIDNAADRLRPGMSMTLTLIPRGEPALAAPELALQWERTGAFIWRVIDGRARRTPVRLIGREAGFALLGPQGEAAPPLAAGDQVVVEGVQRLREGRPVRILGVFGAAEAPAAGGDR